MKPRRKPTAAHKPHYFPDENVAERWDARHLAGQTEFDEYRFVGCDFSGADLSNKRFSDCLFERCNLSSAGLAGTALQNVAFDDCKLLGLQFTACRDMLFGVHFDQCQLRYASFAARKMPATRFVRCALDEADFADADLSAAVFQDCSLAGAVFQKTQLVGADFTSATGFIIDPESNQLRGARFTLHGLLGVVAKYELVIE
ncbi:pentapeptide repeat-containing protein [Hymenobacter sp. BT770]|uniref:pentapeptide repeat-containing protein n=1 Tax=Hymenobacter sp. BT770 TaxID=2886942 RepID=UPI001D102EAB|nr:pentapeptide repeat-containing protein [Hymenobacter sp. BT770]MCC3154198.1 pentapeptide repeat-containing protein [Hymenobacter sp. BT770]MDO3414355.1 pentapeptide repeat-containing protein [Hymenobacter sp. BT770]